MTARPLWERALDARLQARRLAMAHARLVQRRITRPERSGLRCSHDDCGKPANFGDPKRRPLCRRHWLETLK